MRVPGRGAAFGFGCGELFAAAVDGHAQRRGGARHRSQVATRVDARGFRPATRFRALADRHAAFFIDRHAVGRRRARDPGELAGARDRRLGPLGRVRPDARERVPGTVDRHARASRCARHGLQRPAAIRFGFAPRRARRRWFGRAERLPLFVDGDAQRSGHEETPLGVPGGSNVAGFVGGQRRRGRLGGRRRQRRAPGNGERVSERDRRVGAHAGREPARGRVLRCAHSRGVPCPHHEALPRYVRLPDERAQLPSA